MWGQGRQAIVRDSVAQMLLCLDEKIFNTQAEVGLGNSFGRTQ